MDWSDVIRQGDVIKRVIDVVVLSPAWTEAHARQHPAYVDRLSIMPDDRGAAQIVSTLRPLGACLAREAACYCWLPAGHDEVAHVCACGGSWKWVDGSAVPVRLPGMFARIPLPADL